MQNDVPRRLGDDAIVVDHQAALNASRILINAICTDPHEVTMADIAPAIESALRAYGLPPDFPSQVLVQDQMFRRQRRWRHPYGKGSPHQRALGAAFRFLLETLRRLGNPEVIDLDSFKVPVEKRVSKTIRKRRTLQVTEGGSLIKLTQDVDLADGGYYVEDTGSVMRRRSRHNEWFRYAEERASISLYDLSQVMQVGVEMGLIEVGTVLLIKKSDQEIPDGWTMVGDDMIDFLQTKVDVAQFTGLHKKTVNNLDRNIRSLGAEAPFVNPPEQVWPGSPDQSGECNCAIHNSCDECGDDLGCDEDGLCESCIDAQMEEDNDDDE